MTSGIDPQAIQQLYRARYPQMTNEQLNQATRAYIMQVQSGMHNKPAYDKSHYQQEMMKIKQAQSQLYPNMYRQSAEQAGASTSSGWHAGQYAEQMRQQQLLMQQMAAMQQQNMQQQMWARQLQQISAAQAKATRNPLLQQRQSNNTEAEEIVLDGPAITSEVRSPSRQHQSRSRRGRPRLDDDDGVHVISTASARDPITLDDSDDETPSAQQSAAARILALHKKTMGGKEQ